MGREIRMVPPNWKHPMMEPDPIHWIPGVGLKHDPSLQPMYDRDYEEASANWKKELAEWEAGIRPDYFDATEYPNGIDFWEWDSGPPERKYYRPWKDADATWYQLWETVSEGTPVSPPFATKEELAAYLAEHGDDWDKKRGHGGWGVERANAFVGTGWVPSMMIQGGKIYESKDIALKFQNDKAATK